MTMLTKIRSLALVLLLVSASAGLQAEDDALCDKGPCDSCATEPGECLIPGYAPNGACNGFYDECTDLGGGPPSNQIECGPLKIPYSVCVCDECNPDPQ